MNVYMINSGYDGCCYVRILLPAYHNGFLTSKKTQLAKVDEPNLMRERIMWADVVVFHRPEVEEYYNLAEICKKDGKKIVVDNDDTFYIKDNHPLVNFKGDGKKASVEYRKKNMDKFLGIADLATTTTEFLAKEYRKINDNVVVLPNFVDQMDWEKPLRNEGNKVRIGMVGSVSYEYDYKHIKKELKILAERDDIELVLFGLGSNEHRRKNPNITKMFEDEYSFWDTIEKEQVEWCPTFMYQDKLNEARLDLMLIPRKENYFNRCKSNVKFLEASMCETPCIMQSFKDSPYEEIPKDCGILIKDNKDWMKEIMKLVKNNQLRKQMGKKAKEYTLKNFNIENNYYLWANAYNKIYEKDKT